ncbi:MAG: hypothetical protein ABII93_07860 [Chrysiogenia bacterium]
MKKQTRVWSALLMIVLASSLAMAAEKTAEPQMDTTIQLEIGTQDVITASDAGGGYMSTRDILIVIIIIFAIIGLAAVL